VIKEKMLVYRNLITIRRPAMKNKVFKSSPCIRLVLFLVAMFFCLYPQLASAHPPKDVKLSYAASSQALTVTITHKSPFPGSHYINKVEIKKNGAVISTNTYDKQPDQETFDYTYTIAAASGDTIEVTAECNLYGSKTVTLVINAQKSRV
jgi:hypothetical protein